MHPWIQKLQICNNYIDNHYVACVDQVIIELD